MPKKLTIGRADTLLLDLTDLVLARSIQLSLTLHIVIELTLRIPELCVVLVISDDQLER